MTPTRDPKRARRLARRHLENEEARDLHRAKDTLEKKAERLEAIRKMAQDTEYPRGKPGGSPAAPRRRGARSLAVAALILVVVTAAAAYRIFRVKVEDEPPGDAVARVLLAMAVDSDPRPEDLEILRNHVPDESARRALLRNPRSPGEWDILSRKLPDRFRNGNGPTERLLEPRAAISELAPLFRFEVPEGGKKEWHYNLTLSSEGLPDRSYSVIQRADETGPLAFTLPQEEMLAAGRSYVWKVEIDPDRHPEYASLYQPEPARFRVLDPSLWKRLDGLGHTGNEAVDRLIRAAAFNAYGLAKNALDELRDVPGDIQPNEMELVKFLRAESLALLGDRASFEREKKSPPR